MVTGSNPVSGATLQNTLKQGLSEEKSSPHKNYDTILKEYDTPIRLYRVGKVYYYRRRISYKLLRVSLRTKNLNEALKRKKTLDLLKGEELFKLETKDFKLIFEYDTEEELKIALENAMQMQINAQIEKFKTIKAHLENEERQGIGNVITFEQLRDKYIMSKKRMGKSENAVKEYIPTFKKLIEFFKNKNVYELTREDIESFIDYLNQIQVRGKNLSKQTVNKNLIYLKMFLKYLEMNNIADNIPLYDKSIIQKEKPKKYNYTSAELKRILKSKSYTDEEVKNAILIAMYTGMRQGEIKNIEKEDIIKDEESGIWYIDIPEAKSEAGKRKVPIHKNILDIMLSTNFPLLKDVTKENFGKKARYQLYKALGGQIEGKTFHTLRANAIDNLIENNKNAENQFVLHIIQEIVGHTKEDKISFTIDTYKKGFTIKDKKNIIDNINYF